ncbi:MAG: glycerophosphodiester phosphodiesterase family protein, partial [Myxococcota bacterium]
HATKDGILVAFHDDRLDRVTDHAGKIADYTWAELKSVRMANGAQIPLLEDLMTAWPHVHLNIDPKADAAAERLPELIRRTRFGLDRLCVGSFSDRRLRRLREALGPELCTSMGPGNVLRLRLRSWGLPAFSRYAAQCCQVPVADRGIPVADRRFIDAAHRLGCKVHVWTINEASQMHRLLDLGVDGLITDRPTLLKQVLESRGEWGV